MLRPRRLIQLSAFLILCLILIGPWPVSDEPFQNSQYAQQTLAQLKKHDYAKHSLPLSAGIATVDITPEPGIPLGGYSARDPKENTGAMAPVFAKAITINNGDRVVTILGAELLLPMPELVNEVVKLSGIPRDQLFLTATHTHSGPGGYASELVAKPTLGKFHAEYFHRLSENLATIVKQSRENLQPVSLSYRHLRMDEPTANSFIYNQLNNGPGGHESVHWLQLRDNRNELLANLITFSAHPTFLGKRNDKVSGDYPGLLQTLLERQLNSPVLFAVGGVGGMLPMGLGKPPTTDPAVELEQMNEMSARLSQWIVQQSQTPVTWQSNNAIIDPALLPVNLPSQQFRFNDNWRLSPLLVSTLFHNRQSYIHALRIGPLFLFAQPSDYSGELARQLEKWGDSQGVYPWITSFNGDYIGYIMPSEHYDSDSYTVRDANFFGRWAGDYFNEIAKHFMLEAVKP